jgi:hypothetical protein
MLAVSDAVNEGKKFFWALLDARADELSDNDDVIYICETLMREGHKNELDSIPKIHWLQVLKKARLSPKRPRNELELYEFILELANLRQKPLRPIEIRDALDDFIRDGERLLEQWDSRNDAIKAAEIEDQTLRWLTTVTAFVKNNLDVRHVDQLSQYQMTVESTDRWKLSFNLANRHIDITVHRVAYELAFKLQTLRYFRDEIH